MDVHQDQILILQMDKQKALPQVEFVEFQNQALGCFETCLRQIYFIRKNNFDEVITNKEYLPLKNFMQIYKLYSSEGFEKEGVLFLAELLCGFKSRLLGETEIFGQFKIFFEKLPVEVQHQILPPQLIQNLYGLVKKTREQFVKNWGVQSYGAFIRKQLKTTQTHSNEVILIGFGQLAQEVFPWLEKYHVRVFVRNVEKVKKLIAGQHNFQQQLSSGHLEIEELSENTLLKNSTMNISRTAVILAAPIAEENMINHFLKAHTFFDLRDLSKPQLISLKEAFKKTSHLNFSTQFFELNDLFLALESEKMHLSEELFKAQNFLAQEVHNLLNKEAHRPLGWDDLCL